MRSLRLIPRSGVEEAFETTVEAYQTDCVQGETTLESFLARRNFTHSVSPSTLVALIKLDLQVRHARGERPRVADYLERFPGLDAGHSQVVSLIYEEFCLLEESGEAPDAQAFCEAYEPWRDSLLSQLQYHRDLSQLVESQPAPPRFPLVGDRFDKYTLGQVIGTGAVAKVYLAQEDELGGREIVMKVSGSFGQEPTILAKLDHPHIVPILTFARSESGLRGICMPYRPGLTLEKVIKKMGQGSRPLKARPFWEAVRPAETPADLPQNSRWGGWKGFPIDRSFPEAVAWIGLVLSDALEYLHGQGIYHRDIKPANILLAHREGPQLLDFNLSEDPGTPENVTASMKGGTLPYMAPEHLQAFLEVSGWKDVNGSSDLYSLGLILRELATGTPPLLPETHHSMPRTIQRMLQKRALPLVPAREINPLIPPSLDSIFEKCLRFDPADRYGSATELSEDLRRFLQRRPLKHTLNVSKTERAVNWLSRHLFLMACLMVASLALVAFLMLRTPSTISERSDFQKAVVQLDSATPSDRIKARETFDRLYHEHPESAWPTLFLALTLSQFDNYDKDEVNRLIKQAAEKPDAEAALLFRLKKDPESAMLRSNYGLILLREHRDLEARDQLLIALKSDPNQVVALSGLIRVERAAKHYDRAVELNLMLIEAAVKLKFGWEKIYAVRNLMLPNLARLGEQVIDQGATPEARLRSTHQLDLIESTLAAMAEDRRKIPVDKGIEMHLYVDSFYRGFVASSRGVLASDAGNLPQAKTYYDEAAQYFKKALSSISPKLAAEASYRRPVAEKEAVLKARMEQLSRTSAIENP